MECFVTAFSCSPFDKLRVRIQEKSLMLSLSKHDVTNYAGRKL